MDIIGIYLKVFCIHFFSIMPQLFLFMYTIIALMNHKKEKLINENNNNFYQQNNYFMVGIFSSSIFNQNDFLL